MYPEINKFVRLLHSKVSMHSRKCGIAISLVGEPIMYPEINKFVGLLHSKVSMHSRKCGIALNY
jgi:wyosine [tRNA(Phe)-imidazoG37] synthetase (radical SAM superfamily)